MIVSNNITSTNVTSEKLFVNKTNTFKDNVEIQKLVTGPFYTFDNSKNEINIVGNIVSQKDLIVEGNSTLNKNLIVKEKFKYLWKFNSSRNKNIYKYKTCRYK